MKWNRNCLGNVNIIAQIDEENNIVIKKIMISQNKKSPMLRTGELTTSMGNRF